MAKLEAKLCALGELTKIHALPKPLVFTNGVFDVLHVGHVRCLHEARQLGASLVVAINTDTSVKGLDKGAERPLNTEKNRAMVLAGLASVSLVTFFDTPTPLPLLMQLQPDVYVKGGDYDMATLAETQAIQQWGGVAVAIPYVAGYSTTALVEKIKSFK